MAAAELKQIFEYEIHRKLSLKTRQTTSEMIMLINAFKFYDVNGTGQVNKSQWCQTFAKIGVSGFSVKDLNFLFDMYDFKHNGLINYKEFAQYVYGKPDPQYDQLIARNTPNRLPDDIKDSYQPISPIGTPQPQPQPQMSQPTPIQYQQQPPINPYSNQYEAPKPKTPLQAPQQPLQQQIPPFTQSLKPSANIPPSTPMKIEIKEYYKFLLDLVRSKVNTMGGLTYYALLDKIKIKENPYTHQILLSDLADALVTIHVEIGVKYLNDFLSLSDLSDQGYISTNEFLYLIRGPLNEQRKNILLAAFASLDKEQTGRIEVSLLKKRYNPAAHPDILLKKSNEEEILNDFNYELEIFTKAKGIKDVLYVQEFMEFYEAISAAIDNDNYFIDIISSCYNLSNPSNHSNMNANNLALTTSTLRKLNSILSLRGTKGIFGIMRLIHAFDKANTRELTLEEFQQICNAYRITLTADEMASLFYETKTNYELLIKAITGEMNDKRKKLIFDVFSKYDIGQNGLVDIDLLKNSFSPLGHPDVVSNKRTKEEVYGEFLDTLETYLAFKCKSITDKNITIEEFVEYYNMISMGISDDNFFEFMIGSCWGLRK